MAYKKTAQSLEDFEGLGLTAFPLFYIVMMQMDLSFS